MKKYYISHFGKTLFHVHVITKSSARRLWKWSKSRLPKEANVVLLFYSYPFNVYCSNHFQSDQLSHTLYPMIYFSRFTFPFSFATARHPPSTCRISKVNDPPSGRVGKTGTELGRRFAGRMLRGLERWQYRSCSWPPGSRRDRLQLRQKRRVPRDSIAGSISLSAPKWGPA